MLAQAVLQIYPQAKLGIGPAIADGFYYDFDLGGDTFRPDDLAKLEKIMKEIISENQKFEKYEETVAKSIDYIKEKKQPYKLELAEDLKREGENKLSFYRMVDGRGEKKFVDLCAGPQVKSTKELGAFRLTKIAGAYWKGDEKNKMMQRIYGVAFATKDELEKYLKQIEEVGRRDHRKLGQELELFMISEEVGPGLILWQPKGAILRRLIENFVIDEYIKRGYQLLYTPHIGSQKLFSISGHLGFYKDSMYSPMDIDGEDYYVKPMNCPMHLMIYKNGLKSYRDLPVRYTDLGTVYRYERSGTLHGLMRVRGFTQDDNHVICRPDQLDKEILEALKLTKYILETFGFSEFRVALSVRDLKNKKKYLGKDASWKHAEQALEAGAKAVGWKVEREEGEAVFYGPKIDVKVKDSIGREWQISTLQVDFNLPSRFKIEYVDKDSKKKEPFMLHRATLGSLERFVGVLIENYAGVFPVWLAPVQVQIVPVSENFVEAAGGLAAELRAAGMRVWVDELNETVSYKVRKGEKQKIPYILVLGEREVKGEKLNVRARGQKEVVAMERSQFIQRVKEEIEEKK